MNDANGYAGWIMACVATAGATLAGAVATLFKLNESKNTKRIESLESEIGSLRVRADACEKERNEFRVELARLEGASHLKD